MILGPREPGWSRGRAESRALLANYVSVSCLVKICWAAGSVSEGAEVRRRETQWRGLQSPGGEAGGRRSARADSLLAES